MAEEEKRKVIVDDEEINYILIRKKIKNMYLRVRDGEVIVTANARIPKKNADAFVRANAGMIRRLTQRQAQNARFRDAQPYTDGMRVRLLGEERGVVFVPGARGSYDFTQDPVRIAVKDPGDPEKNEQAYKKALSAYTEALFTELCRKYHPAFAPYGVPYPDISIRRMRTRWGSCRPQKHAITLNAALIEAPLASIEYVVVHELAHFLHADHSARFYDAVARVLPDWRERRRLLRGIEP